MAAVVKITGMTQILSNLKMASEKVARGVTRGLVKGGLHLQAKSMEIVPVQLGVLRASSFTRNIGGQGVDADVVVGYTADYAIYVHEDLVAQAPPARAAHGEYFNIKHAQEIAAAVGTRRGTAKGGMFPRGEKQQAKFLEQPMREERDVIFGMVAAEASKIV